MRKTQTYKNYEIVRDENGQIGCPGNMHPGVRVLWTVLKDGKQVNECHSLKRAKEFIDIITQVRTPEEIAWRNQLAAILLTK